MAVFLHKVNRKKKKMMNIQKMMTLLFVFTVSAGSLQTSDFLSACGRTSPKWAVGANVDDKGSLVESDEKKSDYTKQARQDEVEAKREKAAELRISALSKVPGVVRSLLIR